MGDEPGDDAPIDDAESSPPLRHWQRIAAGLIGVAMTGSGGYSVFKTTNQAGSATLLIFGCIFIISAINGARIQGLKLKDADVQWQKTEYRRKFAQVAREEPPEEGRKTLETLATADPQSINDPVVRQVSAQLYEAEVSVALARVIGMGKVTPLIQRGRDYGADFFSSTYSGRIAILVKYRTNGYLVRSEITKDAQRLITRGFSSLLMVTNARFKSIVEEQMASKYMDDHGIRFEFVQWLDARDDDALLQAFSRLEARMRKATPPES